jgi:ketosteroid isomerase-like protein
MTNSLETAIRNAYEAFGQGNVDGYLSACAVDFTFHVPGETAISGVFAGKAGLYALAGKAMEITGGTFREEVEDVLVSEHHAVVLARHEFTRNGLLRNYRTAHVYDVREGKLSRCYEQPQDPALFSDAWGAAE